MRKLTRWDTLKILGLLLMFVDHAGAFYYVDDEWIRAVGRACAPIFFFLVGFAPHYRFSRKLLLLALLLTVVDWWVKGGVNTLNILFTIILIRLLLAGLERRGPIKLQLHEWGIGAVVMVPSVVIAQYGSLGLLFALSGFVFKHRGEYARHTPLIFLFLVCAIYVIFVAWLSEFSSLNILIIAVSVVLMCLPLCWFTRLPLAPVPLPSVLGYVSRYTAEIYTFHLIALVLITGQAL